MKSLYQLSGLCVFLVDLGTSNLSFRLNLNMHVNYSLQLFVSISGRVLNQMEIDSGTSQVRGIVMLTLLQLMAIHYISIVFQIWMLTAMVQ